MNYTYREYIAFIFNGARGRCFNIYTSDRKHVKLVYVEDQSEKNNLNVIIPQIEMVIDMVIEKIPDVVLDALYG